MLHLVAITRKGATWQRFLACVSAQDMIVTWPESAALHGELPAALPAGVRCLQMGNDLDEAALARQVVEQPCITWFDDD